MSEPTEHDRPQPSTTCQSWPIEPTAIVGVLALAGLLAFSAVRYDGQRVSGMHPDAFWAMKADWHNEADIVVTGDSRVLTAVSTVAMNRILPDRRILNFAFPGVGYEPRYLAGTRALLARDSRRPTIVVGVSPRSLTLGSCRQRWFGPAADQQALSRRLYRHASVLLRLTRPIDHADLMITLGLARPAWSRVFMHYHPDGWLAADMTPPNIAKRLTEYETKFNEDEEGPVSQAVIDMLMAGVRAWRIQEIDVFGFRPPSCAVMLAVEAKHAGFDEAAFVRQFEATGGVWLDVDQTGYRTHDGSHISADAAGVFSEDLARMLRAYESGPRAP